VQALLAGQVVLHLGSVQRAQRGQVEGLHREEKKIMYACDKKMYLVFFTYAIKIY
jgi:hypothetical protein